MLFECIIAPINDFTKESVVTIDAKNFGEALVINNQLRPDTVVKSLVELKSDNLK